MGFIETLKGLSLRKKIIAGAAVGGALIALTILTRMAAQPSMALLYAGLDSRAAGEVVTRLDAENVPYEIDGERIYVPASERDRLRLVLAREGLPETSVNGYEILDGLNGFSTTSDMFSAAYWRAKEGELTRTILQIPGVKAARVHIGTADRSVFNRSGGARSASVTVTTAAGLDDAQVEAVQHLAALAVTGVRPGDVAVIDTRRGLLSRDTGPGGQSLDGDRRAEALERELTRLLEARVGIGNARVSVAMRLSHAREAISEERIDPDSAIVMNRTVSEQREEETGRDMAVTVASDLPDGDARDDGTEQSMNRNETRETVEYAVSRMERQVERLPGEVERLTVAVLVNQPLPAEGEDTAMRTAEEIDALRDLVENAAGIDADRGDRVTIQALPFEAPAALPEMTEAGALDAYEAQLWHLAQLALLAVVVLVLGLFVVRPILTKEAPASAALAELETIGPASTDDPVTMLRAASEERPEAAAALLNAWLEEEEAA